MNRSSIFGLRIDFEKSLGSYLYDKNSEQSYLDFFGQYATLALGYNHKIFKESSYLNEIKKISHQKITNCEILSDESKDFDELFRQYTSRDLFTNYHYCCTGALGIEAAVKTAIFHKNFSTKNVLTFKGSFHGINGYGGLLTDRFFPADQRLNGFPVSNLPPSESPNIIFKDGEPIINEEQVNDVLAFVDNKAKNGDICGILVEPIQATYGDRYYPHSFFQGLRSIADDYDIPLIFDEIQIGFGATGKIWYFENLNVVPDILIFGKKTQLSGIMVREKFSKIFDEAIRLEVTWDADIIDMVRCKYT